ncbi:MAG: cation-transporting P-type ATPase [Patescibacteria group bacterium]
MGVVDQERQIVPEPWALSLAEVVSRLQTKEEGITETEAKKRLSQYGSNTFHARERAHPASLFFKQFVNPLIFLLVAAAILTAILGAKLDTAVIAFAVFLNVLLGFSHEYHAENTLSRLTTFIKERSRVIRDGREQEIDSSLLVPGDIIKLSYGSRVPADGRIFSANNFRVDEAILTGESTPVEKNEGPIAASAIVAERKNIAHAGSLVVEGYATAVVTATGNSTEIGKIAGVVSRIKRVKTPLQAGVGRLAWLIFLAVLLIVAGIVILGILRGEPLLSMLVLSAAVAVGAVPEALPIALTIILAIGSERIAKKQGIVRKLSAAETLGSTTLLMTDKTGTLTLADMELRGIYPTHALLSDKDGAKEGKKITEEGKKLLELALVNVDVAIENPKEDKNQWIFRGRPFEVDIVREAIANDVPLDSVLSLSSFLVLPFNSTNKFSVSEKDHRYILMGAPEILLRKSDISKEDYLKLLGWIEKTSQEGKRIIGLADFPKKDGDKTKSFSPKNIGDLNFLGMLVFYDPIRPNISSAIKNIESHGVKMILVTGDLVGTAISVAKSLDWKVEKEEVLSGADLQALSDKELLSLLPKIKIFARVTPEDKLRIGELYRKLGEIVAMTGDGVNDAPALKAMDIGISLGSGSDVAKSAADLVLLDDNFKTISLAIDEGRRILYNIRKAFVYLMSNSLDEILVIGGSLIMGLAFPLSALQIIWVNLFTGSLPALSYAFDENMDKEKSTGRNLGLIFTREVKALAFGVGITSSLLLFVLYWALLRAGVPLETARSVFFVCFSSYILAVAFSFRSLYRPLFSYPVFSNKYLNISILVAIGLLVFTMASPFMRGIFDLAPLPFLWLPLILVWIVFNILLIEGVKYLLRKVAKK